MFLYFKQFGYRKTVLLYWNKQQSKNSQNSLETDFINSSKTISTDNKKELENEQKTVINNKENELKQIIAQKEQIIKVKDEQAQKYALLKQEEKKEKEEWIKKYDQIQKEKNEWIGKFYNIKMYMIIFWLLFVLMVAFEVVQYLK
jgi:lipopolysaccharide export LptBFGC system permease protein LptF